MRILIFLIFFCYSSIIINAKSTEKVFVLLDKKSHKKILKIMYDLKNNQIELKLFSKNKLIDQKSINNVCNFSLEDIQIENIENKNIFNTENLDRFYSQRIYFECKQKNNDSLTLKNLYSILVNTNDKITIHKFNKSEFYLKHFINNSGFKDSINVTFNISENNIIISQYNKSYLIGKITGFDFNNVEVLNSKFLKIEYNVFGGSGVAIKYQDLIVLDRNQLNSALSIIIDMKENIPKFYDYNYKSKQTIFEIKLIDKFKINIKEIIEEINESDKKSTDTKEYVLSFDATNGIFYNVIINKIKMIKFTEFIYKYSNNTWILN